MKDVFEEKDNLIRSENASESLPVQFETRTITREKFELERNWQREISFEEMKQESPEFRASKVEEEVDYVSKEDGVLEVNSVSEMEKIKQEYSKPQLT